MSWTQGKIRFLDSAGPNFMWTVFPGGLQAASPPIRDSEDQVKLQENTQYLLLLLQQEAVRVCVCLYVCVHTQGNWYWGWGVGGVCVCVCKYTHVRTLVLGVGVWFYH